MVIWGSVRLETDFLTIFVAYLFLIYGGTAAGAFAFGQGLLIDLYSGGVHGLFMMLYSCVFVSVSLASRSLNLNGTKGQIIIVSSAVLIKKALFLAVLNAVSPEVCFSGSFFYASGVSAIGTGILAPILFFIFDSMGAEAFEEDEDGRKRA